MLGQLLFSIMFLNMSLISSPKCATLSCMGKRGSAGSANMKQQRKNVVPCQLCVLIRRRESKNCGQNSINIFWNKNEHALLVSEKTHCHLCSRPLNVNASRIREVVVNSERKGTFLALKIPEVYSSKKCQVYTML